MRPLPVIIICLTLMKIAILVGVASLIRHSPADPGPMEGDEA